jgi:hypothetical protein
LPARKKPKLSMGLEIQTIIIDIKNGSMSSETKNITRVSIAGNTKTLIEQNITRKPLSGQAFGTDAEIVFTNPEIRLVIFYTSFGVLGASIHGIGSLTAWIILSMDVNELIN